ncbi:MAG: efflux RND transporter periplasmic adaptor subunit [Pedosphaera sp.]|nr:efflux RND transporter periplasmic adaptor subunit [Pedosphaera sp.]
MKQKTFLLVIGTLILGILLGWFAAGHVPFSTQTINGAGSTNLMTSGRKIGYYQSPMHPWIRSDKPGNCTICGMKLMPVFEGSSGFEADMNIVALGSNTVNALHLQVEPVKRTTLLRTLRLAGVLEDNDFKHRVISAYVDGRIEALHVNYNGAEVQAGEPLADLYSPTLLSAEREYVTLLETKNPLASSDRSLLLDSARIRLKRLGLTDQQIAQLPQKAASASTTAIVASQTGTVVSKFVFAGAYIKEGDKLFELADFSTLWFNAVFYDQDLPWLQTNVEVTVSTPSVPGGKFPGKLTFINPTIDEATRSGRVRIEVENPVASTNVGTRRLLLHRTYGEAEILTRLENVLVIPRAAVLRPAGEAIVYVDAGGNAYERRVVTLGRWGDNGYEVIQGLSESDHVVTAGNLLIDAQAQIVRSGQPSTNLVHQHP